MTAAPTPDDDERPLRAEALDDSIHALAQPLTALLFLLEFGALSTDPQALRATIDDAHTECLRAIKALEQVRAAAHPQGKTGEPS